PSAGLHVGHHLLDVVPIVVHPLVQDIVHADGAHGGVLAALGKVGLAQALHELKAHLPKTDELTEQQAGGALLVSPLPPHLLGTPPVEYAAVLGNDETDPPGKTALLGLDQMSEHLQDAPLIRAGPEREHATRQSGVLATDRIHGGREERHDLAGGEWSGWCG